MVKQVIGMKDIPSKCYTLFYPSAVYLIFHRDPEPFDWYQRYSGVRDLVNQVSFLFCLLLLFIEV
jgi:hypothetical protein